MADDRWRPLSVREKGNTEEWDAPVEGVPPWLTQALMEWAGGFLTEEVGRFAFPQLSRELLRAIELALRLPLDWNQGTESAYRALFQACTKDPEVFLNVIDYALNVAGDKGDHLERTLDAAGSAWSVAPDATGLTRRVLPEAAQAAKTVVSGGSRAGVLIGAAWKHVYGRNPNPGTGYREAVRAIEGAVCPAIIPDDPAPSLGKAIPALRDAPKGKYATVFPETTLDGKPQDPLEAVWKLMQLVWKSELDRHTPADESVPLSVTQEQAEAALHAAVTLVQWFQRGFVRRAR